VVEEEGEGGGEEGGGRFTVAIHLVLSAKLMLQNTRKRVNISHKTIYTVIAAIH
jgi:hypothetical protein